MNTLSTLLEKKLESLEVLFDNEIKKSGGSRNKMEKMVEETYRIKANDYMVICDKILLWESSSSDFK